MRKGVGETDRKGIDSEAGWQAGRLAGKQTDRERQRQILRQRQKENKAAFRLLT